MAIAPLAARQPIVTTFDTTFGFHHKQNGPQPQLETLRAKHNDDNDVALLGPLVKFLGGFSHKKTWKGTGFNMLWRPNHNKQSGDQTHFLELNMTQETLEFTNITGTGVGNRGFNEDDRFLGALSYIQQVTDPLQGPQHFEPGVWINVPETTDPLQAASVARMGSIPHGTTINAQGSTTVPADGQPVFTDSSIIPFPLGNADDLTNLKHQLEDQTPIATALSSRTDLSLVPGLDDEHFLNPTKFLTDAIKGQVIQETTVFLISTEPPNGLLPGAPSVGGGTDNIEMLVGLGNGPNANAVRMTAIFWVETIAGANGKPSFQQLQYTQRVLLNFGGLTWPHVSVATLT